MRSKSKGKLLFIFLISPILSIFLAFQSKNREIIKWASIVFIVFFGSTIIINVESDAFVHLSNVRNYYVHLDFSQFLKETGLLLRFERTESNTKDLYIHFLSFITGTLLQSPGLFFPLVAFIYGYYFTSSMLLIFDRFPGYRYAKLFFAFAIIFISYRWIVHLNTVRTWTGVWVLFYATLKYQKTKERKYLYLMFVPPLIHFSYFIMAIPAWIVTFVKNTKIMKTIYFAFFALSFFTVLIDANFVTDFLSSTELGEHEVEAYHIEERMTASDRLELKIDGESPFYFIYNVLQIQHWVLSGLIFVLFLSRNYIFRMPELEGKLFSISVLTQGLSNSTWYLSSLGDRSNTVAGLFLLATIVLLLLKHYNDSHEFRFNRLEIFSLYISLVLLLPLLAYEVAVTLYYMSVYMFVFPFVPWFGEEFNISLREFVGYFLE